MEDPLCIRTCRQEVVALASQIRTWGYGSTLIVPFMKGWNTQ